MIVALFMIAKQWKKSTTDECMNRLAYTYNAALASPKKEKLWHMLQHGRTFRT
jgi:hypothetical protein